MENGVVSDATRIERTAPTITELADKGAKVILLSHFGRPKGRDASQIAQAGRRRSRAHASSGLIKFAGECIGEEAERAVAAMHAGEDSSAWRTPGSIRARKTTIRLFVAALAKLADLFRQRRLLGCAPRPRVDRRPGATLLPAFAGRTLQAELEAFEKVLDKPARPLVAIVGRAKISTKLDLLGNLLELASTC